MINPISGLSYVIALGIKYPESVQAKRLASSNIEKYGFSRIYHFHVRKTGGTSINNAFLSLGNIDGNEFRREHNAKKIKRSLSQDRVYVSWDRYLINQGNYFYGWSHYPKHELSVPDSTFSFAVFRDPVDRVISHYGMIKHFSDNNIDHPCMKIEKLWLSRGGGVVDFVLQMPKEHRLNQLFMFSKSFDINEAIDNINSLSAYYFTENLEDAFSDLSSKLGVALPYLHSRKGLYSASTDENIRNNLKELLGDEYLLFTQLRHST